ncbi:helix-turn-helix transcriptional regulator [Aureimonas sp. AU20]|uniref:helix-turn-helix transcriptional regulator n=2 Tax=unclassified Aureimonas TaxID=2615206 RepID=UPI000A6343AD|nr:helix-turn-helix transcriptional regulator [Aureimonas sp. AU20]
MDLHALEGQSVPSSRRMAKNSRAFETLDIDLQTARTLQAFGEHYKLTMAELRLAIVLREGKGLKAAARRIGVGYETVRTQMKSVFAKTGAKRQAEVISILSAFKEG